VVRIVSLLKASVISVRLYEIEPQYGVELNDIRSIVLYNAIEHTVRHLCEYVIDDTHR
jgi:hypothetical protein